MFSNTAIQAMRAHAREVFPLESCGLVIDGNYRKYRNRADDPAKAFKINDKEWAYAMAQGGVQAVIHSHPNGPDYPSLVDQERQFAMPDIAWGIVVLDTNRTQAPFFWGDTAPIAPLEGRPWRMFVADCYALVRDWYRQQRKVILPNHPRVLETWTDPKEKDALLRYYKADGWVDVEDWKRNIQTGDMLFIKFNPTDPPIHCAVYVGGGQALHHRVNRPSSRLPIAPFQQMVERVVRRADP